MHRLANNTTIWNIFYENDNYEAILLCITLFLNNVSRNISYIVVETLGGTTSKRRIG
jgi:hypothetical protein